MGEAKLSVYDDAPEHTPLVHADALNAGSTIQLGACAGDVEISGDNVTAVDVEAIHSEDDPLQTSEPTLSDDVERAKKELVTGAGIASGVIGCLLGGPILALLLGFGAAYACDKEGATGDAARVVGELALTTRNKAKEIDERHQVLEKSKVVASQAWSKVKTVDGKYNILDRIKDTAVCSCNATAGFVTRNRLIERGVQGIGKAVFWAVNTVATKVSARLANRSPSETPSISNQEESAVEVTHETKKGS